MKILVIGGMHGNEPLGQEVVKLCKAEPVDGVDAILANEQAIAADSRFVIHDLNRSFPGVSSDSDYETRRAAELLELTKQYDVVLDFHNTHCPDNDCGFVGDTATQPLYDLASWLGLERIIIADYECINKYAPNCLSVEISLRSESMVAEDWYKQIAGLARLTKLPSANKLQKFRFVYRMTLEDKARLSLPTQRLRAFQVIDSRLAKAMGVTSPAYPIFVGDDYTPYNYGGLLNDYDTSGS